MASSQEAMRAEWEALNKATAESTASQEVESVETEETQPVETPEAPTVEEAPVENKSIKPEPSEADLNWRRLREQNKELERRLNEIESIKKREEKKEEIKPDPEDDLGIKDDDIVEGRSYKALKREVRSLNDAIQKERIERDKIAAEARLRAEYPDIFKVVTTENMEELARKKPEVARTILTSTDQYAQYATAYDLIKTYGIGNQDPYADDKARAQKNLSKPKSAATVFPRQGESPLAEADRFARGMTPELQQQLLREIEESIAGR